MGFGSRYHERASSMRSLITSFKDCLPVSFIRCSSQCLVSTGKRVLMLESSIVRGVRAIRKSLLFLEPNMKHK